MLSLLNPLTALLTIVAPVVALLASLLLTDQNKQARTLVVGHVVAFTAALAGMIACLYNPESAQSYSCSGLAVRLDLTTGLLLAGMTLISAVVIAFSDRYMGGDRTKIQFMRLLSALASSAVFLTVTDSIACGAVFWFLISVTITSAVSRPSSSRASVIKVLGHHLCSDLLFIAALSIILQNGITTFGEIPDRLYTLNRCAEFAGSALPFNLDAFVVALLVLSFCIKSALYPFHGWLLSTLDAPTPLSGLLHAGVVNVSGIMAFKLMPLLAQQPNIMLLWGVLAALSAIVGTLSMAAQPDVKRKLVYSTVGQMGFMSLQCATGGGVAALLHLLFHGFFKCHMFLQSGSAVQEGLVKKKYGTSNESNLTERISYFKLIILATASLGFASVLLTAYRDSASVAVSTVIATAAIMSVSPTVSRIGPGSLALYLSALLALAYASVAGSHWVERAAHASLGPGWFFIPLGTIGFAILSIAIKQFRSTNAVKAWYVHALNGFYAEEIARALVDQFQQGWRTTLSNQIRRRNEST